MDQAEQNLSSVLATLESLFVEKLPPVHAGVVVGDARGAGDGRRHPKYVVYFGNYVDDEWGIYVRYPDEWVHLHDATRERKVQTVRCLDSLWDTVVRAAEREIKDTEDAIAQVTTLLKELRAR